MRSTPRGKSRAMNLITSKPRRDRSRKGFRPNFETCELRQMLTADLAGAVAQPLAVLAARPAAAAVGPFSAQAPSAGAGSSSAAFLTGAVSTANPLTSKITVYDVASKVDLSLNLGTGSYYANAEIGAGLTYDTEKIKDLLQGNASLPRINPLEAAKAFAGLKVSHTSNYDSLRQQYYNQYGAENVYFVSERFSDYASPETAVGETIKGIASSGATVSASVKEAINQLRLELNDIYSWAKVKGQTDLPKIFADLVQSVVLQKSFDSSTISVKFFTIDHTYVTSAGAFGAGANLPQKSPHVGFAIVWKTPSGSLGRALDNFNQLTSGDPSGVDNLLRGFANLPAFQSNPTLANFVNKVPSNPAGRIDAQIAALFKSTLGLDLATVRQRYTSGNPVIDLRGTPVEQRLTSVLKKFARGNDPATEVKRFEFNLSTLSIDIEVNLRHRHRWGSVQDILNDVGNSLDDAFRALQKVGGYGLGSAADALVKGANRSIDEITGAVFRVTNDSYKTADAMINGARASVTDVASAIYSRIAGDKLVNTFNAIANGANQGVVAAVRALVGTKQLANSSLEVGKFLVTRANVGIGDAAKAVYDWLGGTSDKLGYAFWAIAGSNGANKGLASGVKALVGSKLLDNSSLAVGKFLVNTVNVSYGEAVKAVYDWLGGTSDKLGYAFWSVASSNGANKGLVAGIQGLVGAKLVDNSSLAVGRFLISKAEVSLSQAVKTVYDWVNGNATERLGYAFWSVAGSSGANKGLVAGIQGLVGSKLLDNSSLAVGKFLLNTAKTSLGQAAKTVYDWLGGGSDNLRFAFWAIASTNGANRSYADGVIGLVNANLIGGGLQDVYNFLKDVLNPGDVVATLKSLGFTVSAPGGSISIPGLTVTVTTSGGSVKIGGYKVKW
ncbi:MAG: hypothetical protein U0835_03900 [Isosphaeraceae bacterium]